MHLAPLTAVLRAVFLRFPFAFTQHLDAGAVDQQVQPGRGWTARNGHLQMLLPPAHGAVIRRQPVQPRQFEQALHHTHGLSERKIEQAFDRQAELNGGIAESRCPSTFADCRAMPAHVTVQPDHQRPTRLERSIVGLPVGGLVLGRGGLAHAVILPRLLGG